MKRLGIVGGLLIGCWLLPLAEARSQERMPQREPLPPPAAPREGLPPPSELPSPTQLPAPILADPGYPPGPSCVGRTISIPRLTLLEEQKAIPVPNLRLREAVVGEARGLNVEYQEAKQVVTEWKLQPREVIQQVPCTNMVPVTVTDPCTGKCRTDYKECPTVREVKITVFEQIPVERTIVVGVPCVKPGQPLLVQKLVLDSTIEPAIASRFQLLTMPNEVPVPVCPAPACPVPPPPHP